MLNPNQVCINFTSNELVESINHLRDEVKDIKSDLQKVIEN